MIMQVEHLTKSFGGRTLFSDVTFKLEEYDRLALVGPNGAGKTTMLNIISGREDADEGRILFAKGARVGYLEQEAIEMPDRPGSLLGLCNVICRYGANIISIHHERNGESPDVNSCNLRIVLETRNSDHIRDIHIGIESAGYAILQEK